MKALIVGGTQDFGKAITDYFAPDSHGIGRSNGFLILDLNKIDQKAPEIRITRVHKVLRDQAFQYFELDEKPELPFKEGNISMEYSVPEFGKFREVEYQYRLLRYQDEWGQWTTTPRVTFSNMPYGDYVFEVRARIGEALSVTPARYSFKVLRPWYLSYSAIGGYALAFILILLGVNRIRSWRRIGGRPSATNLRRKRRSWRSEMRNYIRK